MSRFLASVTEGDSHGKQELRRASFTRPDLEKVATGATVGQGKMLQKFGSLNPDKG